MTEPTTTATATATATAPDPHNNPQPPKQTSYSVSSWGTLEELLLAFAVNRYGINSWDSVATELNNRYSSSTSLFSPNTCRLKYLEIKHRFSAGDGGNDGDDTAAWLDELRRLRVAELKRDLHRYDSSIVSLQLKVKRLKEERETSVKKEEEENCKNDGFEERETSDPKKSDESSNESNFTEHKTEPETKPVPVGPDRSVEPIRGGDSCNGSSNSKLSGPDKVEVFERVDSAEVGESGAESRREEEEGEGVKEGSDVQSTASLQGRERKMKGVSGNSSGDDNPSSGSKFSGGDKGGDFGKEKSGGLVEFLDLVRTRKCGSIFKSRLESQETPRYKTLIKEHIDLGIIQKRVEEGQYSKCHTMFYRDFMLLVNNAIVFFPKRSPEHKFASELRQLVTQHFQTHLVIKKSPTLMSTPSAAPTKPEVDQPDLKPKLAITGPVIASRKRSSIAVRLSASETTVKPATRELVKKEGEKSSSTSFNAVTKKRTRDQGTGLRNPSSKNQSSRPSPSQKPSPRTMSIKGENSEVKTDTKKPSSSNSSSKSKQGASRQGKDLLLDVLDSEVKRKIFSSGSRSSNVRSDKYKDQGRGSHSGANKGKVKEEQESPRNKNTGRPPKKLAEMVAVGKRASEGGGKRASEGGGKRANEAGGKRASDGGRDSNAQPKKRYRR